MLVDKYREQIDQIMAKYPAGRSRAAVMPLLHLAQNEYGYLSAEVVEEVSDMLGLDPTEVGKLVKFYTLYHHQQGGKYKLQVCTDLPCALRGAQEFSKELCAELGVEPNQPTEDGLIEVEEVMCLAACHRAPMFQLQDQDGIHYHENQTVETAMEFIEGLRAEAADD